ncbi:MAG: hypothetical protein H3C53_11115 [Trueperaceae bacterium]|nr:hypothetical protein [Trueperaceae bacterium]
MNSSTRPTPHPRRQPHPRLMAVAALALIGVLVAACGGTTPTPHPPTPSLTLHDAAADVPFAYSPGRTVTVKLERGGGMADDVTVAIDATGLPTGVSLSDTSLSFPAGVTERSLTVTSDPTTELATLGDPLELTMRADAPDLSAEAVLEVTVNAVVMTDSPDPSEEGSLLYLHDKLPDWDGADLVHVTFDPVAFAGPSEILMPAGGLTVQPGWHLDGPVDATGEPYVTLRGNPGGGGIIALKPSTRFELSDLILRGGVSASPGGAVHNQGSLTITNSVVADSVGPEGGGIYNLAGGTLTLVASRVTGNDAAGTPGGGIYNRGGTVTITDSVIEGNSATRAGGVYNGAVTIGADTYSGRVDITGSTIGANEAGTGGGLVNVAGATLNLVGTRVDDNRATTGTGGGLVNDGRVVIVDSEFANNSAASAGGGIYSSYTGDLRVVGSTFVGNEAPSNGGGVFSNGALVVLNSTFTKNVSQRAAGLLVSSNAASIATVAFSTFAGNEARSMPGVGGSVFGGGISYGGSLDLLATVLAGNSSEGAGPDLHRDATGTLDSLGYNLVQDPADSGIFGANNVIGEDPLLGPLVDNGGPTRTMALSTGSPALDTVPAFACRDDKGEPLTRDQRGEPRPAGAACDIGAYESQ